MAGWQDQIDALIRQMEISRKDIDALEQRLSVSEIRADAAELRADVLEAQAAADRDMIADLQRDGVLSQEHALQMEQALKSSRTIGAAIGMIMASRQLSEHEAFDVLRKASEGSNRKLRDLAAELVASVGRADAVSEPARR